MTTPTDEEAKEMLRKYFKDKHQSLVEQSAVFKHRFEQIGEDSHSLTPFRSYMAFAYVATNDLCYTYELLRCVSEDLFDLAKYLRNRDAKLDAIIQEIRNQGVDLSKVKTEVESFKASVNPIAIAKVAKLAEVIDKRMDEYKKKMKENDLAE